MSTVRERFEALDRYDLLQDGDERALSRDDVLALADELDAELSKRPCGCPADGPKCYCERDE